MEVQQANDELSTLSYWDEVLKSAQLPRENRPSVYLYSITMNYADKVLRRTQFTSFFEVGCGSSGWLPYFAKKYGLKVSGLDYSDIGCQLARKNLEMLNIAYGEILHSDFLLPDPTGGKTYDVVFSYGVIEHFQDPEKIVDVFKKMLNPGGIMITLIPNFMGLTGKLTKKFIRDVYDIHNVISPRQLGSYHTANGMEVISNGYAGIFAFGVMPWIKSEHWLFRPHTFRRKMALLVLKATDKILGTLFRLLPFDLPSRTFSPYLICIAKKK